MAEQLPTDRVSTRSPAAQALIDKARELEASIPVAAVKGTEGVVYVTQEMWNAAQSAFDAVLRVTEYMPEGHLKESIRNLIKDARAIR